MEDLYGVPYKLYARQAETERFQALNCATAVLHALRRTGAKCAARDFPKLRRYWEPRSKLLELGRTPITGQGMLLFTHEHFLLLYADENGNGVIDPDDLVIHAYYRPVEVSTIRSWLEHSPRQPIRYVPIDADFTCPQEEALPAPPPPSDK